MIPITRPSLGETEIAAAAAALRSGWLSQGKQVAELESAFADYVGAPHACAVSSCTAALHLALHVLGVGPGDEVITVSHSFIATASAIRYCGAVPVFVDIDPVTLNMDPGRIAGAITERTKAILCVHQVGLPCDVTRIAEIAARHGLYLVEDAACAVGSAVRVDGRWERIGKPHGDIACFSFHPRKVITTGEGGMLTTANGDWDAAVRRLRQHAMSVPDTARHGASQVTFEDYPSLGFNYRMTDIQAAVGCVQMQRLPEILSARRHWAERYRAALASLPGLRLPVEPHGVRGNFQSFWVGLSAGCAQREVMQAMLDDGIATRRGIMCSHREGAYPRETWRCVRRLGGEGDCACAAGGCAALSESERAQDRNVLIPLFPDMTQDMQDRVVASLARALERAPAAAVAGAEQALAGGLRPAAQAAG